jgi:hypothetical protein
VIANEVKLWIAHHSRLFPSWGEWYVHQDAEGLAAMLAAWTKAFRNVELRDAKEASELMVAGQTERAYRPEDHVGSIITAARVIHSERCESQRPRWIGGEPTYACPLCHDGGTVQIWHGKTLQAARRGDERLPSLVTSICCNCPAGDRQARGLNRRDPDGPERYDAQRHLMIGGEEFHIAADANDPSERARIDAFAGSFHERNNPYAHDFGD